MAVRQKKNDPKDIDTRLGALRSDLDALKTDTRDLAGDVGDIVGDRTLTAIRDAENLAERAYRLAKQATGQLAENVESWTDDNLDSMRESVRKHPLSAVALSISVAVFISAIFLRR